jgi:capsular exopolysaccharide synthesis family protein
MYIDPFGGQDPAQPVRTAAAQPRTTFDLAHIWSSIYRSRLAIISCLVAGLALGLVVTMLISPVYRAEGTVEIKREAQRVLGTEERAETESVTEADRFLQTQIGIILSRSTTGAVANELGLYNNPDFLEAMNVNPDDAPRGALSPEESRRELVNQTLLRNLSADLSRGTRIAQIAFESPDPRLAAKVANSYADNFVKLNLSRRFNASRYSLDFLRGQIREAQQRLSDSERRAVAYARSSRIIEPGSVTTQQNGVQTTQSGGSLTASTLVQLNDQGAQATARRIAAEERWRRTESTPALSLPEVLANPAVQVLVQQRAELQGQYEEQLERRKADYPTVKQAAARIAEINSQISTLAGNIRSSIRQDYRVALAQEQGVLSRVNQLKGAALDEQGRGIQLSILRREVQNNRQQFDTLFARFNQLNAESGVQTNNLAIVDEAEVPTKPVSPKLALNLALGLLMGILSAVAFVLGREHLFDVVRTPDDVSDRLQVALLGAVPQSTDLEADLRDNKSAVLEAVSAIRTNLTLSSPGGFPRSVLVTSTVASEGKSTMCYALALSLGRLGKRVILVDADLRRPNVHRLIDHTRGAGTSSVLVGDASLDDVILRGTAVNVDFLPGGPTPTGPADLLAGAGFAALIEELETRYDHVLIDSAPVLGLADAPIVSARAAGTVYVVEAGRTRVRAVNSGIARLAATGGTVLGVVLTRFDPVKQGYSYSYSEAYRYRYGQ